MNVLMIVSDTLRPDYLGFNGGRVSTPNLDALAASSVYFERAFANSFPTLPTRADYLTGRYSFASIGWGPMPREVTTLPELIKESGAMTVGVVDTPFYVVNGHNYDRGFDVFHDLPTQDRDGMKGGEDARGKRGFPYRPRVTEFDLCAPTTMTAAEKMLEKLVDDHFFLYVDTWDPHEPWNPPAYYTRKYKPDYDGRLVEPPYGPYAELGLSEDDLETARACYSGEIEMVDRWVGRLLERLESLGLADNTAVVFTSDHGFYFGERGILGKLSLAHDGENPEEEWNRSPLYRECANVPLMVRVPGVEPRRDPRLIASAINVAPTVLDLFGLEKQPEMVGRSLVPLLSSPEAAGDDITITAMTLSPPGTAVRVVDDLLRATREWQPVTVTSGDWMMLFSRWSEPVELYDLAADGPEVDVADDNPDVVRDLHEKMIAELRRGGVAEDLIAERL